MIFLSYFGISLNDEPFPFAVALRFLQGQKPFVDDLSPVIPLAFLLMPLIKLSLIIHHGKNELLLFLRHLYIVFQVGLGLYVYYSVKKYLPTTLMAFFVAILIMAYHPFGINNFHYDTLGASFWAIIVFQQYNFLFQKNNPWHSYVTFSIFNVLLCLVYPTFIFLLVPLYVCSSFSLRDVKTFWISHILIGMMALISLLFIVFIYFNVAAIDIRNTIFFIKDLFQLYAKHQSIFQKFIYVSGALISEYGKIVLSMFMMVGIAAFFQKSKFISPVLLLLAMLVPLVGVDWTNARYTEIFYFLNCTGFSGSIIYVFFLRKHLLPKRLFSSIWIPSFIAGFLTSTTSSNFALNFIIGFFPAAILGFIFCYLAISERTSFINNPWCQYLATRGVIIYGLIAVAFFQFHYIYGSVVIGLSQFYQSSKYSIPGPFAGLYIEPYWYDHLEQLQRDIYKIDTDKNKYIYFGPFSAGYLFVDNLKPGEPILYCPYHINHFGLKMKQPSYIVFDFSLMEKSQDISRKQYIPAGLLYKNVISNSNYEIYYHDGIV